MISKFKIFALFILILSSQLFAQNSGKKDWAEQNWGLGMAYRYATIPFSTEEKTVGSMVPMLFYENDLIYLKGFEYGIKFYQTEDWRLSVIGRRHFFDAPRDVQNTIQKSGANIWL